MRRIVVSESVTLDGVFDAQTMGQWAYPYYSDERDEFVREIVLGADALLLGRTTYDIQAWYWPNQKDDKYGIANHKNQIPKYVVTSKPLQAEWNNSTVIGNNVVETIAKLKEQPGRDILIEGSAMLVESLTQAGLIDAYYLLLHPTTMGTGRHLFNGGTVMTKLTLAQNKTLQHGVVALSYEPTT
jgi:dihydrofolate reductase